MTTIDWMIIIAIVFLTSAASLLEHMRANTQRIIEARKHDREIKGLSERLTVLEEVRDVRG